MKVYGVWRWHELYEIFSTKEKAQNWLDKECKGDTWYFDKFDIEEHDVL